MYIVVTQLFFITAVGITNQRETTIAWDKLTGAPLHNAIGIVSDINYSVSKCSICSNFACVVF